MQLACPQHDQHAHCSPSLDLSKPEASRFLRQVRKAAHRIDLRLSPCFVCARILLPPNWCFGLVWGSEPQYPLTSKSPNQTMAQNETKGVGQVLVHVSTGATEMVIHGSPSTPCFRPTCSAACAAASASASTGPCAACAAASPADQGSLRQPAMGLGGWGGWGGVLQA